MRIAFITPPYDIQERYGTKMGIKKGFLPPLGLASIATVLQGAGHRCRIYDLPVYDYTKEEIVHVVKAFDPEIVAMAAVTPTMDKAALLTRALKEELGATFVFGGVHPSLFPVRTLEENPGVHAVVIGEAEHTFLELADAVEKRKSLKDVKGICYRENGAYGVIRRTEPRPVIQDLNTLPIPSREFFEMERYVPLPNQYKVLPVTNMVTGRGCPYAQCTFCFEAGEHRPLFRRVSVGKAIDEVRMLHDDYGIREISFWDDVFLVGEKWVGDFCRRLKEERLDIAWSCYGFVNYMTPGLLKTAAAGGCWNIFYGLEAGNQQLLQNIKKQTTLDHVRKVITWTHEAGIETRGSFILGLPGETPELAKETVNFAIELDLDYAQFTLNTPFPSTEMYATGKQWGDFSDNFTQYSVHNPIFLPKGYTDREQLVKMRSYAYRKFYLRPGFIWKHLKRIKSIDDVRRYASGFKFLLGIGM